MDGAKIDEKSSILITRRNDRSFAMAIIQFLVRRVRSQLGKRDSRKHESGSIRLGTKTPKLKLWKLNERTVCDIYIYDFVSLRVPDISAKKRLYYFAGGSWQTPPTNQHYEVCEYLAEKLSDTIVSIVSIPLAPNDPAPTSYPRCLKMYHQLMADAKEAGEQVILAGDSSGGNIILALTLEALREDKEKGQDHDITGHHPKAIMAICPSTDLTRDNPDIQKIAPRDPLLTPDIINSTAKAWRGDWDASDRRLSPINNDTSLLAKHGIHVHGVTAGNDILSPDGVIFRDRCAKDGIKGEWLDWQNQMHCFMLTLPYGLKEARECMEWIVDVLRRE